MIATRRAVAEFIAYIRSVRGLSPHTVAAYRRDLACLVDMAGDKSPAQISVADLRGVLAARRRAATASLLRQISAWRAFYDYLIAGGAAAANPARAILPPKRSAHLPKALNPDEMSALLAPAAAGDSDGCLDIRDAAIMELFYSSALRLSELIQLDVSDVNLADGIVYVRRGKGGRGRTAPLGACARQALKKWLPQREQLLHGALQPALFVSARRTRLSARAIQRRVDRHVKKTGFAKPVSPHVFRHSCASHFLQSSGDLRATQDLLGHRDISATQIYTHLDFQHLAKVYDTAHPRAKK